MRQVLDDNELDAVRRPPPRYVRIDHIALAVRDLEQAVTFFCETLGFELRQRRQIAGATTGMSSAEIESNGIKLVLCQGTQPESQVSRLVENFGPGVAHIALEVDDVECAAADLARSGLTFDTPVISGGGLTQIFSSRDSNSGMSFEFIRRDGEGFSEQNIQKLFNALEASGKF